MNIQELGKYGEKLAASYLQFYGYDIIETRYSCAVGEVDIVARNAKALVFVEVKTRHSYTSGHGTDTLTPVKLKRMQLVAGNWMVEREAQTSLELRIDLISILVHGVKAPYLEHYEAVTA